MDHVMPPCMCAPVYHVMYQCICHRVDMYMCIGECVSLTICLCVPGHICVIMRSPTVLNMRNHQGINDWNHTKLYVEPTREIRRNHKRNPRDESQGDHHKESQEVQSQGRIHSYSILRKLNDILQNHTNSCANQINLMRTSELI